MKKFALLFTFLLLSISCSTVPKAEPTKSVDNEVDQYIDFLVNKHQFNREEITSLLKQAHYIQPIIDSLERPAESKTWGEYRKIFLTPLRIEKGVLFYQTYREALEKAEKQFNVPAEIITAILGVETLYGQNKGNYSALDALYTIAFHYPKRSRFFKQELTEYLLLTREEGFNPTEIKGSYAAAMGFPQFISSSYRNYAVDFDEDKKRDLFNSPIDAIGSIANYFNHHKWHMNETVVIPAIVEGTAYKDKMDAALQPTHTLALWKQSDVLPLTTMDDTRKANLLALEGVEHTEFWLAFHNFYVITRYNHSPLYAMAVYQLSQEIKAKLKENGQQISP